MIVLVGCVLLGIGNIVLFAYLSSDIWIVVASSIITALLSIAIYKLIIKIIEEEASLRIDKSLDEQKKLLDEKNELEKQKQYLEQIAIEREATIKNLESDLDLIRRYKSIRANEESMLKLETMEYEKQGYIIKEEYVRSCDMGRNIERDSKWKLQFDDKGDQKILYIEKFRRKTTVGIDLSKIRFCRHQDYIYLEGVSIVNLLPEISVQTDNDSVKRCIIVNVEDDEITGVNHSKKYEWFKHEYSQHQKDLLLNNFNKEIDEFCHLYTRLIRNILTAKFPGISFVDTQIEDIEELAAEKINLMNTCTDYDIIEVSNSISLVVDTIHQTMLMPTEY
jgi:hypothetical protein